METKDNLQKTISEIRGLMEVLKNLNAELYELDTNGMTEKTKEEFFNIPLKYTVITKELDRRLTQLEEINNL